jgi:DNA-binding beta-propeller fold protein YncE
VRFENPWKFALTPDGRELLVLGSHVTSFSVDGDGLLSDPVDQRVRGVRNPQAIAVGGNRTVYAAGGMQDRGRVTVLNRNPATGALTARSCAGDRQSGTGCRLADGVDGPSDLAVPPDHRAVYLAAYSFTPRDQDNPFGFNGTIESSAVSVFSPQRAAPKACLLYAGRERNRGGCHHAPTNRGPGFSGASTIAVTPNGKAAVAGFAKSAAVALLLRNPRTQGLSPAPGRLGCVRDATRTRMVPRGCAAGHGINQPSDIAISPDSRNAYVATPGGLVVFSLSLG